MQMIDSHSILYPFSSKIFPKYRWGGIEPATHPDIGYQDDTNPVWSPDGSRIAFLRRTSAETLLALVIPSRGGPEQV